MIDFPIRIENEHVIDKCQAKISILSKGVNGVPLNFSHKFRDDINIIRDLGLTFQKLIEITPGGILVFFSSYKSMQTYYDTWDEHGLIHEFQ